MIIPQTALGTPGWVEIFNDSLNDGIPGPYPFETRDIRSGAFAWSENGGVLTANGDTSTIDKVATAALQGNLQLTVDFNIRDLLPGEWYGLQMGDILANDNDATSEHSWVHFAHQYNPQGRQFRFINKSASFDQHATIDPIGKH